LLAARAAQIPRSPSATLDEAFAWCWKQSRRGDATLLSPACASLDQFRDYVERGERFVQLVSELSKRIGEGADF
jgi:UDP-N-acetylmuramoylalanine--D-glutamate ligase